MKPLLQPEPSSEASPLASVRAPSTVVLWLTALLPTVSTWLYFVILDGESSAKWVYVLSKLAQLALPLLFLRWVVNVWSQRRSNRLVGSHFGWLGGTVFGLGSLAAVWALAAWLIPEGSALWSTISQQITFKAEDFGLSTPVRFWMLALGLSLINSAFEELYWRWFLFGALLERMRPVGAAVVAGLAFTLHHLIVIVTFLGPSAHPGLAVLAGAAIFVGALSWSWLLYRAGSPWGAWIAHILADLAIMSLGHRFLFG